MSDISKIILPYKARTDTILSEARTIRSKPILNDTDLERLAELKIELISLCPPLRYAWHEGAPVMDIWAELLKTEEEL